MSACMSGKHLVTANVVSSAALGDDLEAAAHYTRDVSTTADTCGTFLCVGAAPVSIPRKTLVPVRSYQP